MVIHIKITLKPKELEAMASEIHKENTVHVVRKQQIPRNSSNQEFKNWSWQNNNPRPSRVLNHREPKERAEDHRNTKPRDVSTVGVLTQDQRDALQKGNRAIRDLWIENQDKFWLACFLRMHTAAVTVTQLWKVIQLKWATTSFWAEVVLLSTNFQR